ncbi:MAG TPA: hypothetical protein GXZ37_02680 [Clostridiales bacterium]|jgi:hypothetical protein|nr:hypothetical protein [Clostridiales bacterium]
MSGQTVNGKPLTCEDIKLMAAEQVRYATVKVFVWDKLDNSINSIGINLTAPVEIR